MSGTAFDYLPLSTPVSLKERRQFRRSNTVFVAALIIVGAVMLIAFMASMITRDISTNTPFAITTLLMFLIPTIAIPVFVYVASLHEAGVRARMMRFAAANDMKFFYDVKDPLYDGMLFQVGHTRSVREAYRLSPHEADIELGNYHYETGSGKQRQTFNQGYIAITLPRKLPHMVLDAKANNFLGRFSNLPRSFSKDQKLSLEGDFDRYFTLYAPRQYEHDALYILTPDIMQLLVSQGSAYDIEIIGDQLYIYHAKRFDLTNAQVLAKLFELVDAFQKKFDMRVDYYADERVGDRAQNTVAAQGATLKKRPVGVIAVVIVLLYFALTSFDVIVRVVEMFTN